VAQAFQRLFLRNGITLGRRVQRPQTIEGHRSVRPPELCAVIPLSSDSAILSDQGKPLANL
jgi:hypothetical protein